MFENKPKRASASASISSRMSSSSAERSFSLLSEASTEFSGFSGDIGELKGVTSFVPSKGIDAGATGTGLIGTVSIGPAE